jgi:hypothetical protein
MNKDFDVMSLDNQPKPDLSPIEQKRVEEKGNKSGLILVAAVVGVIGVLCAVATSEKTARDAHLMSVQSPKDLMSAPIATSQPILMVEPATSYQQMTPMPTIVGASSHSDYSKQIASRAGYSSGTLQAYSSPNNLVEVTIPKSARSTPEMNSDKNRTDMNDANVTGPQSNAAANTISNTQATGQSSLTMPAAAVNPSDNFHR